MQQSQTLSILISVLSGGSLLFFVALSLPSILKSLHDQGSDLYHSIRTACIRKWKERNLCQNIPPDPSSQTPALKSDAANNVRQNRKWESLVQLIVFKPAKNLRSIKPSPGLDSIPAIEAPVTQMCLSPNGSFLAVARSEGSLL